MIIGGLDLETTGFLEAEHRIIECCLMRFDWDGEIAKPLKSSTWRIDPDRPIEAKAFEVHKISNADLIGKPKMKDIAPEISAMLDSCEIVVAHNGIGFDFPFVAQEFERVRQPLPDFQIFDTMTEGRWATSMGEVPSLQALCFACGVDYDEDEAHSATYDVSRMMECLWFGIKRGTFVLPKL